MKRIHIHPSLFTACFLLLTAYISPPTPSLAQGPLAPPGAPAPTMKTLEQVEPRVPVTNLPVAIDAPGSYYFTGTLVATNGGITIETSNVTLDLMGFELVGGTGDGIFVDGVHTNILIRNGTVQEWSDRGIRAELAVGVTVERVIARLNGAQGMHLGNSAVVRDCAALDNDAHGFEIGDDGVVIRSTARGNGTGGFGSGFLLGTSGAISESTVAENTGDGIFAFMSATIQACTARNNNGIGIAVLPGGTIADSTASGNGSHGFQLEESGIIRHSNATGNSGHGIQTAFANVVIGCEAAFNMMSGLSGGAVQTIVDSAFIGNTLNGIVMGGGGHTIRGTTASDNGITGINATEDSTIINCTANGNAVNGIEVGSASTIIGCTANKNGTPGDPDAGLGGIGDGITAGSASTVLDSTVKANQGNGIAVTHNSHVARNTATFNEEAGIRADDAANRIEANHATGNNDGFAIQGVNNLVIKNSASGNAAANYTIFPGNHDAEIITAPGAGFSVLNPWANFEW